MQTKLIAKKLLLGFVLLASVVTGILGLTLPIHNGVENFTTQEVVQTALTTSQVKTVQTKLKNWGYYTGVVDGIYGSKTKSVVSLFSRR